MDIIKPYLDFTDVMQFWSENILVISNQGDAVFDFKVSQYDFTSNCTPINSIPIINQTFLGPIITNQRPHFKPCSHHCPEHSEMKWHQEM